MKKISCPMCGNTKESRFEIVTDRIRDNQKKKVFKCLKCTLVFLDNTKTEKELDNFYRKEYKYKPNYRMAERIDKVPLTMNQIRFAKVRPFLTPRVKLLDIGCGSGGFLKMVKPFVKEADGVELSEAYVKKLRKENINVFDKPIDSLVPGKTYDIICIFHTLEHIPNLGRFLESLKALAHPGSRIFIEVPNVMDALVSFFDMHKFRNFYFRKTHLYYFSPETLSFLLKKHGLKPKIELMQCYSFTNHMNWLYLQKPQENLSVGFTSVLPADYRSSRLKKATEGFLKKTDASYRSFLMKNGFSDLIWCETRLKDRR